MARPDLTAWILRGVHPIIYHAVTVLSLFGAAASWWFHAGPFRWSLQAQLATLGEAFDALTWVLAIVMLLLPLAVLARALTVVRVLPRSDSRFDWYALSTRGKAAYMLLIYGAAALIAGLYLLAVIDNRPSARRLEVAKLESGEEHAGIERLVLAAVPVRDAAISISVNGRPDSTYVPLVYPVLAPGSPIAAILRVRPHDQGAFEAQAGATGPNDYPGAVIPWGLPGLAIEGFESSCIDVSDAVVLDYKGDHDALKFLRVAGLAGGAIMLFLGGLFVLLERSA